MSYSCKQLSNGRWGIYQDIKLLATIGCHQTCQKIVTSLSSSLPSNFQVIEPLVSHERQTTKTSNFVREVA
jgi:hypothetical protein